MMPMPMPTEPQDQDDFDGFDSTAGVMAYAYSRQGSEGLHELLAEIDDDRESLERGAAELEQVGLPAVAAILQEYAGTAPEAGSSNPFPRRYCQRQRLEPPP
jgi:hypothetical protein